MPHLARAVCLLFFFLATSPERSREELYLCQENLAEQEALLKKNHQHRDELVAYLNEKHVTDSQATQGQLRLLEAETDLKKRQLHDWQKRHQAEAARSSDRFSQLQQLQTEHAAVTATCKAESTARQQLEVEKEQLSAANKELESKLSASERSLGFLEKTSTLSIDQLVFQNNLLTKQNSELQTELDVMKKQVSIRMFVLHFLHFFLRLFHYCMNSFFFS